MKNILLICGGGASSGFMAANMRKAAKKEKLDFTIQARSESELEDHLDSTDILLIGPHLSYMEEEIKSKISDRNIKVAVIPQIIYGPLDGKRAIQMVLDMEKN
ncbi:PTS system, cellobiose-specific IIB component [Enterococcus sp. AZ194]|uniref:PTS sugar transporter subunit IIB n=1 Tax=Enterococcus sp. AZ194 TaxID=2774629 RepID=UPI003F2667E9